jgi:hypothetical protein
MLDLHCVVMDNNALDHQFEDSLLFADAGRLQSGGDTLTEGDEIGHGLPGSQLLFAQATVAFVLLFGCQPLISERPAMTGQLFQADDRGLIGFQQSAIRPVHPLDAGPQLIAETVLPMIDTSAREALELRQDLGGISEQIDHMGPDGMFQRVGFDAPARAFRLPAGCQWVSACTTVVPPANTTTMAREVASVNP